MTTSGRRATSMTSRMVAALVAATIIGASVIVFTSTITGGDDPEPKELSGAAKELAGLLVRRSEATYHARYEATTAAAGTVVVETWQKDDRARQEQRIEGSQPTVLSTFVLPSGRVNCLRLGDQPWACRPGAAGDSANGVDPLAGVRERLRTSEVTARDARVESRAVRCFRLTAAGEQTSELCVVPDQGVPVRVTGGTTQLRLIALEAAVDDAVFDLPAPVAPAS